MAPRGFEPIPFPYDIGAVYNKPAPFYDVIRQTREDDIAIRKAYEQQAALELNRKMAEEQFKQEQAQREAIGSTFQNNPYDPATADGLIAGALLKQGAVDPYLKLRPQLPTSLNESDRQVIGGFSGINVPQGATQQGVQLGIRGQSAERKYPSARRLSPDQQAYWGEQLGVDPYQMRTQADIEAHLRLKGQNRLENVNQRETQKFDLKKSQLEVSDYQPSSPDIRITETEKNRFTKELQASKELQAQLGELAMDIEKTGGWEYFGNDSAKIQAYAGMIFNAYRKVTGSGARLEGPEAELIKSMTPAAISSDPVRAIKNWMLNRDPSQLARDMIRLQQVTDDASASALGLVPRGSEMQLGNASQREIPQFSAPEGQKGGPPPGLSFEQFKQWKRSQGR